MQSDLSPGVWVINPAQPEWGLGQVQSAVGDRVTVNFEHTGKMVINTAAVRLEAVDDPDARVPGPGSGGRNWP
jgi:hypothetical protein